MSYASADLFDNSEALLQQIGLTREQFTGFINTSFIQDAIVAPTVVNLSAQAGPGIGAISCPNYDAPEPTKINTDGGPAKVCITPQAGTYGKEVLTPDCELGDGWCISKKTRKISSVGEFIVTEAEVRSQKFALAKDKELLTKMSAGVDAANIIPRSGTDFLDTVDDIVNLRKALNKKLIPQTDRYLLIGCEQEAKMLTMDEKCFLKADAYGSRESLLNGEIGRIMGFSVIVSTLVDDLGGAPLAYHRSHAAWADWCPLEFETDYDPKCKEWQFYLSVLFGTKVMNGGCRAATLV